MCSSMLYNKAFENVFRGVSWCQPSNIALGKVFYPCADFGDFGSSLARLPSVWLTQFLYQSNPLFRVDRTVKPSSLYHYSSAFYRRLKNHCFHNKKNIPFASFYAARNVSWILPSLQYMSKNAYFLRDRSATKTYQIGLNWPIVRGSMELNTWRKSAETEYSETKSSETGYFQPRGSFRVSQIPSN
jgi:hypothetical protein